MPFPLSADADGRLSVDALPKIKEKLKNCSVCVIGPGMGRSAHNAAIVREVLGSFGGTVVADADALWAISEDKSILKSSPCKNIVLLHLSVFEYFYHCNLSLNINLFRFH